MNLHKRGTSYGQFNKECIRQTTCQHSADICTPSADSYRFEPIQSQLVLLWESRDQPKYFEVWGRDEQCDSHGNIKVRVEVDRWLFDLLLAKGCSLHKSLEIVVHVLENPKQLTIPKRPPLDQLHLDVRVFWVVKFSSPVEGSPSS
jgi:hypothetical protein